MYPVRKSGRCGDTPGESSLVLQGAAGCLNNAIAENFIGDGTTVVGEGAWATGWPPGCFISVQTTGQHVLFFNSRTESPEECSDQKICLCKLTCPPGTYQDQNGESTCKTCPTGKYQDDSGQSSCKTCASGTYSTVGASSCPYNATTCPAGTYATATQSCDACVLGKYNELEGQTGESSCKSDCNAGSYISFDKNACLECLLGQYQDQNGQSKCIPCGTGKYNERKSQTDCKSCNVEYGEYQNEEGKSYCDQNCESPNQLTEDARCIDTAMYELFKGGGCGIGWSPIPTAAACARAALSLIDSEELYPWWRDGINNQLMVFGGAVVNVQAPLGCTFDETKNNYNGILQFNDEQNGGGYADYHLAFFCTKTCPPGTYQDQSGQSSCKDCDAGKYQDQSGKALCKTCEGYTTSLAGASSCEFSSSTCPVGTRGTDTGCDVCELGKYNDQEGQTADCKSDCNAGSYINLDKTACLPCIVGQYQDQNGKSNCKLCGTGKYNVQGGQTADCKSCAQGEYQNEKGKSSCNQNCESPKILTADARCIDNNLYREQKVGQCGDDDTAIDSDGRTVHVSGDGWGQITSAIACGAGAAAFGWTETSADLRHVDWYPTGCYDSGSRTYFNTQRHAKDCNRDQKCLCTQICPPGTYQDQIGQSTCKDCASGQYQKQSGQSSCYTSKTCAEVNIGSQGQTCSVNTKSITGIVAHDDCKCVCKTGYSGEQCQDYEGCNVTSACNYNPLANKNDNDNCKYKDCAGTCGGSAVVDECAVCGGLGIPAGKCNCDGNVTDCAGTCGGSAVVDCAGECGGSAVVDCDSDCGGSAVVDECGVCGGLGIPAGKCNCDGNVTDCAGTCGGSAVVDECAVCGGLGIPAGKCNCDGNVTDCAGTCGGKATVDECEPCRPGQIKSVIGECYTPYLFDLDNQMMSVVNDDLWPKMNQYNSSYPASNCVDGDPTSMCHTYDTAQTNNWLKIKLLTPTLIGQVTITNRPGQLEQLGTFELSYYVDADLQTMKPCSGSPYTWEQGVDVGGGISRSFACPGMAHGIQLKQTGDTRILNLMEVSIQKISTRHIVTDNSQLAHAQRVLFTSPSVDLAPISAKSDVVAMFQGDECTNTMGLNANTNMCACGSVTCTSRTGLYCLKQYSTCYDNLIVFVPTRPVASGLCKGEFERPIVDRATCVAAATALNLHDTTLPGAAHVYETGVPRMCFFRDALYHNVQGDSVDGIVELNDVSLCHYERCLTGFKLNGTSCVDVCDASAKTTCSNANKEACTTGTATCGECKEGFKLNGTSCVDVCDAGAKTTCSNANKEVCSEGVNSIVCGACKYGFKLNGTSCVDVCDAGAKTTCSNANKEVCSEGVNSIVCGACKYGFKLNGTSCVDVCDAGAKTTCSNANKEVCSEGVNSIVCGACKYGFKLNGTSCVDVCDASAKTTCSNANKEACTTGTATCGACKEGFVLDGISCVARQACSAAADGLSCTAPAIKDDAAMCVGKVCESIDFGNSSKACCMDNVCNTDAESVCSSAHKETCSPGTTTCGACKEGFVLDGISCVARQACSAAADGLSCTAPAIKDDAAMCAGKVCDASVDFGGDSKACCMYDVCDDGAKTICSSVNKTQCSVGSKTCGECLTGFDDGDIACTDWSVCNVNAEVVQKATSTTDRTCKCKPDFYGDGIHCHKICTNTTCSNGGTCHRSTDDGSLSCTCNDPWEGDYCNCDTRTHSLSSDNECVRIMYDCLCDHGSGKLKGCAGQADQNCDACVQGYFLHILTNTCKPNQCTCDNGTGTVLNACLDHNTDSCHSCEPYYHKVQDRCDANVCNCPNGTALLQCAAHEQTVCSACNEDYQLSGSGCQPIENKRGDIEYTTTISNTSLTNVEIENKQQFTTGFVHKVLSRKRVTALASTHVGQKRLLSSGASQETVKFLAYDNATKVKGVYLTITNIINQDPFKLSMVNSIVITFSTVVQESTTVVQESTSSLNILTLILFIIAAMIMFLCVCRTSRDKKPAAKVTPPINNQENQPLLQVKSLKF